MADEVVDTTMAQPAAATPAAATPEATPAQDTSGVPDVSKMTEDQQNDFVLAQARKLQRAAAGDPAPQDPVSGPVVKEGERGPDGKFLKKDGTPGNPKPAEKPATEPEPKPAATPEVKPEKPAVPAPAATKPADAPKPAPEPESATAPIFDIASIMADVDKEVGAMKFKDAPDDKGAPTEITGAESAELYGQIVEPLKIRQDLAIKKLAERMNEIIRPVLDAAQARQVETHQTAVQQTIAAVVAAGVPDAAELIADPRIQDFAKANPHLAALLVTDPSRADDIAFVLGKFRAANGIAVPASAVKKPAPAPAPAKPAPRSPAIQAALATAHDGGAGEIGGDEFAGMSDDDKVLAMTAKLQREAARRQREMGE